MPGKRLRQAACVLAFGALALKAAPLRAGEITVVLTKVDDGDAKHVHNGTVIPGRVRRQILRLPRPPDTASPRSNGELGEDMVSDDSVVAGS